MKTDWYKGLNPEQAEAVQHNEGPLLILAGAGSGKTTVLVHRTGRLISDGVVTAKEILVLTFTNKAARELKHRVANRLQGLSKGLWAGTFHSFGLQILRDHAPLVNLTSAFGVMDQSDSLALIKELASDIKNATKDKFDASTLLNLVNEIRVFGRIKSVEQEEYSEMAQVLAPLYSARLFKLGVVDFEGLLLLPLELFEKHPHILSVYQNRFKQVMVDEFQDTNRLQMKLIEKLVESHKNVSVVGDDDQSIYGWRGAEIQNILNFPHEYENCKVVKLERNYRSSASIINLANDVISKNSTRHGKILRSQHMEETAIPEVFVLENEEEECDFVVREIQSFLQQGHKESDIAILYRSNMQGGLFESSLRRAQINYKISGGTSIFDRKEAKDVMAYLKFAVQPNEVSLRRILNTPSRGIGDTSIDAIEAFAEERQISFLEAIKLIDEISIQNKVKESIKDLMSLCWTLPSELLHNSQLGATPGARLQNKMKEIGYRDYLAKFTQDLTALDRKWMVIEIFGRILDSYFSKRAQEIEVIRDFVDAMTLRDDEEDEDQENVQLMTFHASKGLEYPVVLLAGIEEDLLPHKNLGTHIDEERRLFYVGITRAKKRLVMSRCQQRKKHGAIRPCAPSRFITEVNKDLFKEYLTPFRPVSDDERKRLVAQFLNR